MKRYGFAIRASVDWRTFRLGGNEIIHSDNPKHLLGFKVDVLTGVDAKALKSQNDFNAAKQAFMKYWWIIPVLLLLIWWKS